MRLMIKLDAGHIIPGQGGTSGNYPTLPKIVSATKRRVPTGKKIPDSDCKSSPTAKRRTAHLDSYSRLTTKITGTSW
jgi:hypothetical protein